MKRLARQALVWTAAVFVWGGLAADAWADRRVALVVGNSKYQKVTPLPNPSNDATDVADILRGLDFQVISVIDADQIGFNRALGEFSRKAIDADAVLFFYAGHGIQVKGQNYFLPIDADARDEISAEFEFIAMDRVRQALDRASQTAVRIMILDACRDNPLARTIAQATRGVGEATRGLARIDQQSAGGMVVVYATQPNQVAQDGAERNSPFTSALLLRLREPGLEVGTLFRRVTNDVRQKTGGKQVPELSISLGQDYYLNRNETDSVAFDRIVDSGNPQDFREFIARFPNSSRAPVARRMIDMLEGNIAQRQREQEDERRKTEASRIAKQEEERARAEQERVAAVAREQAAREAEETRRKAEQERLALLEQERLQAERKKAEELVRRQQEEAARLAEVERKKVEEAEQEGRGGRAQEGAGGRPSRQARAGARRGRTQEGRRAGPPAAGGGRAPRRGRAPESRGGRAARRH
ncbi:MAG: caspase family protein [Rhizobiales bacterium]|nr:caspase family protein [Hyphomicrobiales bacterium]